VRRELYRSFTFDGRRVDWDDPRAPKKFAADIRANPERFADEIGLKNRTLAAVAALCAIRDTDGQGDDSVPSRPRYSPNPDVHAVVNFNVDSLFRLYVAARYRPWSRPFVRTVERASKEHQRDEVNPNRYKINIYHMHGNLRIDPSDNDQSKEAPDKLVFKEGQYFDFFNSPTGMFTYTFLSLLREHSFLFVGLSMQDDNIRRLLHYSTMERRRAYIDEGKHTTEAEKRAIRHWAILTWSKERALNAAMLRDLGTQVLWISDYGDIPTRLGKVYEAVNQSRGEGQVYEAAHRRWGDVYTVAEAPGPRPQPAS
jgi:SIR2-like domain